MAGEYLTIRGSGKGEYTEKKSRFLGLALHVESEEEAAGYLEKIRKQYYDARHNCYAWIIGEQKEKIRSSDDGEPSGTAGQPILKVLEGSGCTNVMIIVTRYFGGTLLGTGGLVRAYTRASREALEDAELVRMCLCERFTVTIDYSFLDRVMYYLRQAGIAPDDTLYSDRVGIVLTVRADLAQGVRERITTLTGGGALFEEVGRDFYPVSVPEE